MRKFGTKAAAGLAAGMLIAGLAGTTAQAAQASGETGPVPGCGSGCSKVFDRYLGNGIHFEGYRSTGGFGPSFAATRQDGKLTSLVNLTSQQPNGIEYFESGQCSLPKDGTSLCLVTGAVGAHSEAAMAMRVDTSTGRIAVTDSVLHSTPTQQIGDLNGDGIPDVALRESTWEPDYARAPQYYLTYALSPAGKLTRSGCSAPTTMSTPPPRALLTGSCYA
ncbi:hypothetical protein [Sciscionella sediminilitoris]|uniref:hypothetical protein n=1 Tax=Sciscionella sediminilitoris TaxID=1445613 RepID=UPI000AC114C3|nr:hypothetical protein [Sciscionella sp. SE31]